MARDFEFEAPDRIPAGAVTFQLTNEGPEPHHAWIVHAGKAGVASSAGYVLYLAFVGGRSLLRRPPPVKPRPPV